MIKAFVLRHIVVLLRIPLIPSDMAPAILFTDVKVFRAIWIQKASLGMFTKVVRDNNNPLAWLPNKKSFLVHTYEELMKVVNKKILNNCL